MCIVHKTPEEIKKMNQEREQRQKLKEMRRREQERNVERKKAEKEAHRLVTSGEIYDLIHILVLSKFKVLGRNVLYL